MATVCELYHGDSSCECGCHVDCERVVPLETKRFGFGQYDGVSADGWHVMDGNVSVAGPYCDRGVAERHLREIEKKRSR